MDRRALAHRAIQGDGERRSEWASVAYGARVTIAEIVERGREAAIDCGPSCWLELAKNKSLDHESCYLCGCDIEFMGGDDDHEDWCPTVIARRVLGLHPQKEPQP